MALFFAVTLFTSALLLFLVQPMVGKMALPLMGGAPAVWNTCMVFFQALLLAGYAYAHWTTRKLGVRNQARTHLLVLGLPLLAMAIVTIVRGSPVAVFPSLAPQGSDYPFFGVVLMLLASIGIPFFVVATSAPLLQMWFAETDHPDAKDPYFLYGASNFGSLLALVLYPLLIESRLRLSQQGWLWGVGYALLAALTYGCAVRLWRSPEKVKPLTINPKIPAEAASAPISNWTRLRWIALALVPSSLMLSVTTFVTTDISPYPLFWIIPLALYLLTFIIAFGRTPAWVAKGNALIAPVLILLLIFLDTSSLKLPSFTWNLAVHLLTFFSVALMCHCELARTRPPAADLTEFYLWMSVGGVLGGLFNALLAPLVFKGLTEYPLALIAGALMTPPDDANEDDNHGIKKAQDYLIPIGIFLLSYGLLWAFYRSYDNQQWNPGRLLDWTSDTIETVTKKFSKNGFQISPGALRLLVTLGIPALICYIGVERPIRFGLGVLAIWLAGLAYSQDEFTLYRERSFFGRVNVEWESEGDGADEIIWHRLTHGTTLHGKQQFKPVSNEPLTYYHRTGPLGAVMRNFPNNSKSKEIAAIGLGTGSVAAYGEPGRKITFYEIDTAVRRIAENPAYFTYLRDCKADKVDFAMGDARLEMERQGREGQFAAIVVDAFSSDAIPMHLLTLEAVKLYMSRLAEGGILCIHISNRYLDLEPVCGKIAEQLGLVGMTQSDFDSYDPYGDTHDKIPGKQSSVWVMLARNKSDLDCLINQPKEVNYQGRDVKLVPWTDVKCEKDSPLWTDDFSNLLQAVTAFQK